MSDDPLAAFTEPFAEDTKHLLKLEEEYAATLKPLEETPVEEQRARNVHPTDPPPKLDNGVDRTIPGPGGPIPIRVLTPEKVDGVYLYFHGGGWIVGAHDVADERLWALAQATNAAVVSVGYRLAPEHPYPAGPDDCEAAALWLIEHSLNEFGTDRMVIGGDSAGAHLSAVTLLRLRDRHGCRPFCGAQLLYGLYDGRLTPSIRNTQGRLGGRDLTWAMKTFSGGHDLNDPDISPLLAPLHDMPPAIFVVGTKDPLVDDTLFMWARWRAAGNEATLKVYPGGLHAFDVVPSQIAQSAVSEMNAFMRARFTT